MKMKSVVIVGGGFGGLNAAITLGNTRGIHVQLIDRHNYHLFQPLLYQIATAGLSPADIAVPLRSILSHLRNTEVIMAEIKSVDLNRRLVESDSSRWSYDYLVLACGANHSYFGQNQWEEFAPGLKTLEQATEIRRRVFLAYEKAEKETDPLKQKALLTFIIVGGGPTGVELAGALGEISHYTLGEDFRHIDPKQTEIILVEAGPRILPSFSEDLAKKAARDLKALGVSVRTSSRVTEITKEGVQLAGEFLHAETVLWAAGIEPAEIGKKLGVPVDRAGRVIVGADLSLAAFPEVFVIGDQAAAFDEEGKLLPGLAPVAMKEGEFVARTILKEVAAQPREIFHYRDKGQMATIGRKKAIVQVKKIKVSGFVAWLLWLFVHIYYLIGFKNRVFVFLQWAWSYFTFKRGSRLILNKEWRMFSADSNGRKT